MFVVATALLAAAMLFRPQVSTAVVTRGDEFLYRSDLAGARKYYARAILIDPNNGVAVDRLAFFGMQLRTPASLQSSLAVTEAYLAKHPDDANVRADRGLCLQILKRYRLAAREFAIAASQAHDARYYTFAGWDALRSGDRTAARKFWQLALNAQPQFSPALGALRQIETK